MAYDCPRCGGPIGRGSSAGAQAAGGLVGVLVAKAFGSYQCESCGKIPRKEFPPEIQKKMTTSSVIMIVSAVGLLILVVVLLASVFSAVSLSLGLSVGFD